MKNVTKRIVTILLITAMLLSSIVTVSAAWEDMTDVSGHWAEGTLKVAYNSGLMVGYNGKMEPDASITTAEMMTMLCRILKASESADISDLGIAGDPWYKQYAAQAKYLGIIDSSTGNLELPVSRTQAFGIISRSFGFDRAELNTAELSKFKDCGLLTTQELRDTSSLMSAGLIEGTAGHLNGQNSMTRAEFATMIYRILKYFTVNGQITNPEYSGGVLISGSGNIEGVKFSDGLWFDALSRDIRLSGVSADSVVIRSHQLNGLSLEGGTSIGRLVLASQSGSIELLPGGSFAIDTLSVARGGGDVLTGGSIRIVEVTGNNRSVTIGDYTPKVVISGNGNTVTLNSGCMALELEVTGKNNAVIINGAVSAMSIIGDGNKISGSGTAEKSDVTGISNVYELQTSGLSENPVYSINDLGISITAPTVLKAGEPLVAVATVYGLPYGKQCQGDWYVDGVKVKNESVSNDGGYQLTYSYKYKKDMPLTSRITYVLSSSSDARGWEAVRGTHNLSLENYDDEYYIIHDNQRILNLVGSKYLGNYTTEWAIHNDYNSYDKELWVNAKGYSSDTEYLIWVSLAYQRVNIFTGGRFNWKLLRSGIIASGSNRTPTPVGVWKTTYKEQYGWTTGHYTVKPVVRFKGGGYAFHSRLYYPNTTTVMDSSIGFPVSLGCIRMYDEDINFLYDYIPGGTTVVVH